MTLGLFNPCALPICIYIYVTYLPFRTNSLCLLLLPVITQDISAWITQYVTTNIFLNSPTLLNLTNHAIYILWEIKGNSQLLIPHLFKQCQHDYSALSWARSSRANMPRSLQGTANYSGSQKPVSEISSALTLRISRVALCCRQHLPASETQSKRQAVWPLVKAKANLLQEGDINLMLRRAQCPTYFTVTLRMF